MNHFRRSSVDRGARLLTGSRANRFAQPSDPVAVRASAIFQSRSSGVQCGHQPSAFPMIHSEAANRAALRDFIPKLNIVPDSLRIRFGSRRRAKREGELRHLGRGQPIGNHAKTSLRLRAEMLQISLAIIKLV